MFLDAPVFRAGAAKNTRKNPVSEPAPHPAHLAFCHAEGQPDVHAHHALRLAQLHLLALGQLPQRAGIQALQPGQGGVIAGVHQGAVLGQVHRTALFQHLADELGAEIVPPALPPDVQPAEQQPQRVEPVEVAVVHHMFRAASGPGIGFIRDFQRIERAGDILPLQKQAPVEVLPAGARREHGIAVFAGGTV